MKDETASACTDLTGSITAFAAHALAIFCNAAGTATEWTSRDTLFLVALRTLFVWIGRAFHLSNSFRLVGHYRPYHRDTQSL